MRLVGAAFGTVAWSAAFYGGTVLLVFAAALAMLAMPRAFQPIVRQWARWQRWTAAVFLRQHVRVEGEMPATPALLLFKHESMFETIDLPWLLDRPMVFAKDELLRVPLWSLLARRYGIIFIARDAGAATLRRMREAARAAVAAGRPLVLMPEGTRVRHGEAPPVKAGFAGLYKLLDMPAVPVAVDSGRLRHGWIRLPGTITYRVGEVIPPRLPREEAEARVHRAINALNRPK